MSLAPQANALSTGMTGAEIRATGVLTVIASLRLLGLFLILPVFAVHAQHLPGGANTTLVGLALGIYAATQAMLQIPFGVASDRFGRKPVIVAGLVLFALGSFVAASATDLWTTILGRALQGGGAISAAVSAFIADSTRDEHRTKAMAALGMSIGLVFALSLVAAPPLYTVIGMGGLFALTGVLALAAIPLVLWGVPPAPQRPTGLQADKAHWSAVVFAPELLRLNFGIFALHAVQMALFIVVPSMMIERGLPLPHHWWVYLPVVFASFFFMLPPLITAERRARMRPVMLGSIAMLAVVHLGLGWVAPSLALLVVWLLLFFTAFNLLEACLPSLVSRRAPPDAKGLALGVYNTTQAVGLFIGGALGGLIVKHGGAPAVFLVGAGAMLAWLIVAWRMQELPLPKTAAPQAAR
jgi:MFS family permease